ncbi:DUF1614 domain-containing protein [Desulfoscipio geothermicus]|uniref:Uncharacterized membrane protein n=1 Tax=Desulfoscipio geothermicus DSM 3669 TaxID=1121426 RepID=A0A1I6CTS6_9FIRM|nr:DUF1614 domain-containing protein [Desulfoscipio geothermicus]SFQ96644.1 Uncharacterized membrane protein [Desulfoscipio geothermicus DSM 3669]
MTRLPIGIIVLIAVSILIYFGLAQRVLDRMRLSDRAALGIIALLAVGSFIDIPLSTGRYDVSVNLGGALVPLGVAIYLLTRAGTDREWGRALLAAVITGAVIFGVGNLMGRTEIEPGGRFFGYLDALWVYPIIGGLVAYIAGRSRRSAFIAATLGLMLVDVAYLVWLVYTGAPAGRVAIGGAGAFDGIVLAGIVAVLLAEIIGETRERLQGGPASEGRSQELMEGLRKPGINSPEHDRENSENADHREGEQR